MLTLKTYAHAMRQEEADLSFADLGDSKRLRASPALKADPKDENAPELTEARRRSEILEHETGFEPATLTLAT